MGVFAEFCTVFFYQKRLAAIFSNVDSNCSWLLGYAEAFKNSVFIFVALEFFEGYGPSSPAPFLPNDTKKEVSGPKKKNNNRLLQGGPLTNYKWVYKPYKWPYKWVTGVITLLIGVITPFITSRGPPCGSKTNPPSPRSKFKKIDDSSNWLNFPW